MGRSTVFLMVLVILFGVCAVEGGSILFTRLSLQDTADAAANQSAGTYFNSNNFQQAEQTAKDAVAEQDPTAKLVGFQVNPNDRTVTVILRKTATTLLARDPDLSATPELARAVAELEQSRQSDFIEKA